jgi:ubiquitin C-terminal hydrolase
VCKYNLVAVVQHYGGRSGGHYTATCLRDDGTGAVAPYLMNDSSATKGHFGTTPNDYLLFYVRGDKSPCLKNPH